MKKYAVILAGGSGERFASQMPKTFFEIENEPMLAKSLRAFQLNSQIDGIILVTNPEYLELTGNLVKNLNFTKVCQIIPGGRNRQESSKIGIKALPEDTETIVLIHDAARPFVSQKIIDDNIAAMENYPAAVTAFACCDTVYEADESGFVGRIPLRNNLWSVQTPQTFRQSLILKAHELADLINKKDFTDDGSMVHYFKLAKLHLVNGDALNKKITYQSDL